MGTRISRSISIILRSERLIARRHMAVMGQQAGMVGAAAILGALGLVMLNVASYLALAARMDPAFAALIVALVNLIFAGILISWARGMSAERDVREVCEVRDMAIADLEGEVQDATDEVRELADNVRKMAQDPIGTLGGNILGPLLAVVLKQIRK